MEQEQPHQFPGDAPQEQDPLAPKPTIPEDLAKKVLAEIEEFYQRAKEERKPFEQAWFLAASMLRGQQRAHFSQIVGGMVTPPVPSHRVRLTINKIRPKVKARIAKFTKNRPIPVVIPASTDREDRLNATATQKILDYLWRKLNLEAKFKQALLWATISSKGFWWIYWDDSAFGRVKVPVEGIPNETTIEEAMLGDVAVEVGSPFEVFVDDLSIPFIGNQPRILRVKLRPLDDIKARYPEYAEKLKADHGAASDLGTYEKQIASLNGKGQGYGGAKDVRVPNQITVKEFFERPCAKYPKGRYVVVAGDCVVKIKEELPFGFSDMENPYPVVEFNDSISVGQFWNTTLVEQLIDIQREYNLVRSMVAETLKLMARPKILVYKQHRLAPGAWSCVDEETTVLTRTGWKNYRTLRVGEAILSYDPETKTSCWLPNKAVNVYDYVGNLYRLKNRNIDALVTPNHKWLVETSQNDRAQKWEFIETSHLEHEPKRKWAIPLGRAGAADIIGLPESDAFFELLGWICAEGTWTGKAIVITQHKSWGQRELKRVLSEVCIPYSVNKDGRKFYIPVSASAKLKEYIPNKRPEYSWLTEASESQLDALLRGLVMGDGNVRPNGQVRFYNNDYALCEMVQTIAMLLGRRASVVVSKEAHAKYFAAGYGGKTYQCERQYSVFLGSEKKINRRKPLSAGLQKLPFEQVPYVGKVWCPTVDTHAVFFKRGDRVYVSGQSEPGEIVEVVGIPGLPPPQVLQPANIASDAWQTLNLLRQEFDDLSQIYPASEGKTGSATSGFQTNLLQEAADSVHAPEIREHELAVEQAAYKFRRLMKLGYDIPRLVTIAGRNYEPDVIEFSKSQIDEYADIVVKAGSALPDLPASRIQGILELFDKGILGDINDPEVKRRALSMLDMKGLEVAYEEARRDEDVARRENAVIAEGGPLTPAEFFHDHIVHMAVHADALKSAEATKWTPEQKLALVAHLITHVDFQNPQLAMQLRLTYGLQMMPPALPPPPPQMLPPGPDGGPPPPDAPLPPQ